MEEEDATNMRAEGTLSSTYPYFDSIGSPLLALLGSDVHVGGRGGQQLQMKTISKAIHYKLSVIKENFQVALTLLSDHRCIKYTPLGQGLFLTRATAEV
jgi:hypothetical protein